MISSVTTRPSAPRRPSLSRRGFLASSAALAGAPLLFAAGCAEKTATYQAVPVDDVFALAAAKYARTVQTLGSPGDFPRFTNATGAWETTDAHQWSAGFFAGCLWSIHEFTREREWRERAIEWTLAMEGEKSATADHNNGFKMLPSFGNDVRLTGDDHAREVLVASAASLATRFNSMVGAISANDMPPWSFPVMVDTMANVELLLYGAANGGDPVWRDMALSHARVTLANNVRPDGSTSQIVDIDPATGAVLGHDTLCGLAGDSFWMRGQGQALYGFTACYRYAREPRLLDAACKVADAFIAALPDDCIPWWDTADPAIPNTVRDTSAATVAASGLVELAGLADTPERKDTYYQAAAAILSSLCSPAYLDRGDGAGLLGHATWKKPTDPQADTSLIWGEYYFLEALLRFRSGV